jgi:hypothetical protein
VYLSRFFFIKDSMLFFCKAKIIHTEAPVSVVQVFLPQQEIQEQELVETNSGAEGRTTKEGRLQARGSRLTWLAFN